MDRDQHIGSSCKCTLASMLRARLDMTRSVSIPDSKHVWKIKPDETQVVDDEVFVRINTKNSSLSSLIGNVGGFLCLTRSEGLQKLVELRNKQSELTARGCTLFEEQQQPIKKRQSRSDIGKARREPSQTMKVPVGHGDDVQSVVMLKPAHPSDSVMVRFEETDISIVLDFLMNSPFASNKRARNPDKLPHGINRLGESDFLVKYTTEGILKRKKFSDISSALEFHADPIAYLDAQEEQQGTDEQPDEAA